MADFLRSSDPEVLAAAKNFHSFAKANLAKLGLKPKDETELKAAINASDKVYDEHVSMQEQCKAKTKEKDAQFDEMRDFLRALAAKARANAGESDKLMAGLGLPVYKKTKTAVGAPETRPVGEVDTRQRLRHVLHFRDEFSSGRAKPKGVFGCQVWIKIGGESSREHTEFQFIATDTKTPYIYDFEAEDAEKTAYYLLRWVSTRGDFGPWSETIEATVTG